MNYIPEQDRNTKLEWQKCGDNGSVFSKNNAPDISGYNGFHINTRVVAFNSNNVNPDFRPGASRETAEFVRNDENYD